MLTKADLFEKNLSSEEYQNLGVNLYLYNIFSRCKYVDETFELADSERLKKIDFRKFFPKLLTVKTEEEINKYLTGANFDDDLDWFLDALDLNNLKLVEEILEANEKRQVDLDKKEETDEKADKNQEKETKDEEESDEETDENQDKIAKDLIYLLKNLADPDQYLQTGKIYAFANFTELESGMQHRANFYSANGTTDRWDHKNARYCINEITKGLYATSGPQNQMELAGLLYDILNPDGHLPVSDELACIINIGHKGIDFIDYFSKNCSTTLEGALTFDISSSSLGSYGIIQQYYLEIKLTDSEKNTVTRQLVVLNIPSDDGHPVHLSDDELKYLYDEIIMKCVVAVHCRAGLGRTAQLITTATLLKMGLLDTIFSEDDSQKIAKAFAEHVKQLRAQRPGFLLEYEQIWHALKNAIRYHALTFAAQNTKQSKEETDAPTNPQEEGPARKKVKREKSTLASYTNELMKGESTPGGKEEDNSFERKGPPVL